MPPTDDDKAFRWRLEDSYRTVTGEAFAKLVHENGLEPKGPFNGYWYAMKHTTEGEELYRTLALESNWDAVTPIPLVTSANPVAGAANVTVYTCPTGKIALIEGVWFTYVRDANAANVLFVAQYDNGTNVYAMSATTSPLIASETGYISFAIGSTNSDDGATEPHITAPLPRLTMRAGDRLLVLFTAKQATDDCGTVYASIKERVL